MRIQFTGSQEVIEALQQELAADELLQNAEIRSGSGVDSDRLAFELGEAAQLIGGVVASLNLAKFAHGILKATTGKKQRKLELVGPAGKVMIDTTGKDPDAIAALVRSALVLMD